MGRIYIFQIYKLRQDDKKRREDYKKEYKYICSEKFFDPECEDGKNEDKKIEKSV
jgi:hypothetical protein